MSTKLTKYLAFTGVALFLLVGGVLLIEDVLEWTSPKPTYSCTGSGTAKLLKEAIESGPLSRILNMAVYQVDVITHPYPPDLAAVGSGAMAGRASRMAASALRPARRPVATMEQRSA